MLFAVTCLSQHKFDMSRKTTAEIFFCQKGNGPSLGPACTGEDAVDFQQLVKPSILCKYYIIHMIKLDDGEEYMV